MPKVLKALEEKPPKLMNVMCSFLFKFDYVPVDCKLANASHLMKVSKKALKNCWPIIMTFIAGKLVEVITNVK